MNDKNFELFSIWFFGASYFLICTLFWKEVFAHKPIGDLIVDLIFVIGVAIMFIDHWRLYFKLKDKQNA